MIERTGKLVTKGKPLTLLGAEVTGGQRAPDFRLRTTFEPDSSVTLDASRGLIRILSVAPSFDTRVCRVQAIRFHEEAAKLSEDIVIYQISVDLPPAQSRFCKSNFADGTRLKMVSDYADRSFGIDYGILIKEWQTLGRALFVVDRKDIVQYVEYVPDIGLEPDYVAALAVVGRLSES